MATNDRKITKRQLNFRPGWTIRYTLLNATYFVAFCTIHACAAVYLLANGFSNTEVGILLAVANILSAIVQPIIAGVIDKPGPLTNRRFILISVLVILAGSVTLMFVPNNKYVIFPVFALIYMIQFAYQPVMTALCFEYQKAGANIFYGLARGLGSASFAVTSAIIGGAVEKQGVTILLWVNIAAMVLSAVLIWTFVKPSPISSIAPKSKLRRLASDPAKALVPDDVRAPEVCAKGQVPQQAHNNFFDFVRTYPAFSVFLVGTICFFFAHNMINDFMIQIIRNLGGGERQLGYANFLQAILELPVMALSAVILKKISSKALLTFSGVAFLVKILILVFAGNMAMMYLSQSVQLFAYAVFIPAAAYYVSSTMEELDQVKGQAFVTSAITIGGVFSNLVSGVILDHFGIRTMLITGSVVCAVGVCIGFFAMGKLTHHKETPSPDQKSDRKSDQNPDQAPAKEPDTCLDDLATKDGVMQYLDPAKALDLHVVEIISSTNSILKEQAAAGAKAGTVLIANCQTGGRGRMGRSFFSPMNTGLYISVLLRPSDMQPEEALKITTIAAVAACEAIETLLPSMDEKEKPQIKWVNDIFLRDRKVAGILTESGTDKDSGKLGFAVLGIGLNITTPEGGFPEEIKDIAGAILPETGADQTTNTSDVKNRLAAAFLNQFFKMYDEADKGRYQQAYKDRSLVLGKFVHVIPTGGGKVRPAKVLDITETCGLVVQYEDGEKEQGILSSGEVSIRPQ